MASIISAGTTSGTSLNLSGDTSGVLQLASNGSTTALTISTAQVVTLANALPIASGGTGATSAGTALSNLGGLSGSSSQLVKAWVKYDGSAQTIYASYNVSSVTYLSSGRYQVNFTTAFSSANYAACVTASVDGQIGVSGAFKFGLTEQASTYLAGSCVIGTGVVGATSNTAIISAIFIG
jgi:hypothetical protein